MVNRGFTTVNHMVELPYPKNHGSFLVGLAEFKLNILYKMVELATEGYDA